MSRDAPALDGAAEPAYCSCPCTSARECYVRRYHLDEEDEAYDLSACECACHEDNADE